MDCRSGWGGHHANMAGQGGDRLLMSLFKQTFAGQFKFEGFKSAAQGTFASGFHFFSDQLIVTAPFIETHFGPDGDLTAFLGWGFDEQIAIAKHGTTHLGLVIFEGEIPMAGAWPGEVGHATLYPHREKDDFQQMTVLPAKVAMQ